MHILPKKAAVFLVLTFLLTWILWWPLRFFSGAFPPAAYSAMLYAGAMIPALVALLLWRDGAPLSLRHLFTPKFPWPVLALSILGIPALLMVSRLILPVAGGPSGLIALLPQCLVNFVILIPLVLGEELGWRGFLLPWMLRRYSFDISSIAVGMIWSLWHLPLFFIGYLPVLFHSVPLTFLLYAIQTTCCSIFITWLFLWGNQRIWVACLIHAAHNAMLITNPRTSDGLMLKIWATMLALALLFCAGILWVKRKKKPGFIQG